jgi:hypothetical protein
MSPLKKEYLLSFSRSERFAGFDPYFRSSRFRTEVSLLLSKMYPSIQTMTDIAVNKQRLS